MYEYKKCKTIKIYFFLDVKIKKNPSVLFDIKKDEEKIKKIEDKSKYFE